MKNNGVRLVLEDGAEYFGESFGFPKSSAGEVVFNTGMVGYPESFTDPSYKGQLLVLTYPLIGNYGMPITKINQDIFQYYESQGGQISGLIVDNYSSEYQHWNAQTSLAQWLYNQKISAISGIDTRALTKRLREKGTMLGKIIVKNNDTELYDPNTENLVDKVSIKKPRLYGTGNKRIILIDCGCKNNILRELINQKVEILRVPWDYPVLDEKFDGLFVSNGPGDPKMCTETIKQVEKVLNMGIPTMGICLGNQIIALAVGADTYKMKYGHRSQNQPVINKLNNQCFITTQNHGYVVDMNTIPKDWQPLYINLNDNTCEGLFHKSGKFFSVQFHPEANPGPMDTSFLFEQFIKSLP